MGTRIISRELKRNSRPRVGNETKKKQAEQIVDQMVSKKGDENSPSVSIEIIYQYVYRQHKHGEFMLNCVRSVRRGEKSSKKTIVKSNLRCGKISNKTMTDKCPKIVNDKY